jgi:7-carboxy-7-deazaguanine synthase
MLIEFEVLLSIAYGKLDARDVVKWMLDDRMNARFQLQLHKHIWDPEARGV